MMHIQIAKIKMTSESDDIIAPGTGVLTMLEVQGDPTSACLVTGDTELVIADPDGVQMYSWVDNCLIKPSPFLGVIDDSILFKSVKLLIRISLSPDK